MSEPTDTLRWVVAKLGRFQAVQDEHTLRLERLGRKVDAMDARLGNVERKLDGLIEALPGLITDAVRAAR